MHREVLKNLLHAEDLQPPRNPGDLDWDEWLCKVRGRDGHFRDVASGLDILASSCGLAATAAAPPRSEEDTRRSGGKAEAGVSISREDEHSVAALRRVQDNERRLRGYTERARPQSTYATDFRHRRPHPFHVKPDARAYDSVNCNMRLGIACRGAPTLQLLTPHHFHGDFRSIMRPEALEKIESWQESSKSLARSRGGEEAKGLHREPVLLEAGPSGALQMARAEEEFDASVAKAAAEAGDQGESAAKVMRALRSMISYARSDPKRNVQSVSRADFQWYPPAPQLRRSASSSSLGRPSSAGGGGLNADRMRALMSRSQVPLGSLNDAFNERTAVRSDYERRVLVQKPIPAGLSGKPARSVAPPDSSAARKMAMRMAEAKRLEEAIRQDEERQHQDRQQKGGASKEGALAVEGRGFFRARPVSAAARSNVVVVVEPGECGPNGGVGSAGKDGKEEEGLSLGKAPPKSNEQDALAGASLEAKSTHSRDPQRRRPQSAPAGGRQRSSAPSGMPGTVGLGAPSLPGTTQQEVKEAEAEKARSASEAKTPSEDLGQLQSSPPERVLFEGGSTVRVDEGSQWNGGGGCGMRPGRLSRPQSAPGFGRRRERDPTFVPAVQAGFPARRGKGPPVRPKSAGMTRKMLSMTDLRRLSRSLGSSHQLIKIPSEDANL